MFEHLDSSQFWKVVEPLGGRATMEEVGHYENSFQHAKVLTSCGTYSEVQEHQPSPVAV